MNHFFLLLLAVAQPHSNHANEFCRKTSVVVSRAAKSSELPINFEQTFDFWRRRLNALDDLNWADRGLTIYMPQVKKSLAPQHKWMPDLSSDSQLKMTNSSNGDETTAGQSMIVQVAMPEGRGGYVDVPGGRISLVAGQPLVGMTENGIQVLWIPQWNQPTARVGELTRPKISHYEIRAAKSDPTERWQKATSSVVDQRITRGHDQMSVPVYSFNAEKTKVFGLVVGDVQFGNGGFLVPDITKVILLNPDTKQTVAPSLPIRKLIDGAYRIVPLGPEKIQRRRPTDGLIISSYLLAIVPEGTNKKEFLYFVRVSIDGKMEMIAEHEVTAIPPFTISENRSRNLFTGRVPHIQKIDGRQVLMIPTKTSWTQIGIPERSEILFEPKLEDELPSGPHYYPRTLLLQQSNQ